MKVQTRTQTSTATTVALSIAIGAAAAFAAISLNNAIKQNYNPLINIPLKKGPAYTRTMCQDQCGRTYDICIQKSATKTCVAEWNRCDQACIRDYPSDSPTSGYMVPPETTPGYMLTPEVKPPVAPGYTLVPVIPPILERLPPWVSDDNPPDPKINPAVKQPAKK